MLGTTSTKSYLHSYLLLTNPLSAGSKPVSGLNYRMFSTLFELAMMDSGINVARISQLCFKIKSFPLTSILSDEELG